MSDRITINLSPPGADGLRRAIAVTFESKTDAINRALTLYGLLHEVQDAGGAIYLRESADAELERMRII